MAEGFLHSSNIVAIFKQVRGEAMSEGVASDALREFDLDPGHPHRFLQNRLVQVIMVRLSRARVGG